MRDILLIEKALRDIVSGHDWVWPEKAVIEIPRDAGHGDLATNLAMVLSRQAKAAPRTVAENIVAELEEKLKGVVSAEIAGIGKA